MYDVGARLTTYAITHVETINKEYSAQVNQWKDYLNLVADAQKAASDHVQSVLENIKRKRAEEEAEFNRFMLIAFSLVAIAGTSWLGAIIEFKLYPRFAGKKVSDALTGTSKLHYSEVAAKTFGDTVHESTGLALDKILEKVWPKDEGARTMDTALSAAIDQGDLASFNTRLEGALLDEAAYIVGRLGILSENINKSSERGDFGDVVKEMVETQHPRPHGMTDEDYGKLLKTNGETMIDEYFDQLRQNYATDWFYYGNNPLPAQLPFIKFYVEIETWALWLLNQEWKDQALRWGEDNVQRIKVTDDGIDLDSILRALEELAGAELSNNLKIKPRTPLGQPGYRPDRAHLGDVVTPNQPVGWVQEIDPPTDTDRDAANQLQEAAKYTLPGEYNEDGLNLAKILDWARSHPGKRLYGDHLDYRPRRIGSIADAASVFADTGGARTTLK